MRAGHLSINAVFTLSDIDTICSCLVADLRRAGADAGAEVAAALERLNPTTTTELDWNNVVAALDDDPTDLLLPYRVLLEDLQYVRASLAARLRGGASAAAATASALSAGAVRLALDHLEELA